MAVLSHDELDELNVLIGRARALYDNLIVYSIDDLERHREAWSEIVEVQDRITVLLPPAPNPLLVRAPRTPTSALRAGWRHRFVAMVLRRLRYKRSQRDCITEMR